ncbi:hypothetical protein GQ54DRAFT_205635 [Martensiomyces pterosporus]|nr:hypothetical protein GQ54DRAFT_205635 [Martensiomyces pterosporus]
MRCWEKQRDSWVAIAIAWVGGTQSIREPRSLLLLHLLSLSTMRHSGADYGSTWQHPGPWHCGTYLCMSFQPASADPFCPVLQRGLDCWAVCCKARPVAQRAPSGLLGYASSASSSTSFPSCLFLAFTVRIGHVCSCMRPSLSNLPAPPSPTHSTSVILFCKHPKQGQRKV